MADTPTIAVARTGKAYTIPVADGAIRASDLLQIKTGPQDPGLVSYEPAHGNTADCTSSIGYVDGDQCILRYRRYPIEQGRVFVVSRCASVRHLLGSPA